MNGGRFAGFHWNLGQLRWDANISRNLGEYAERMYTDEENRALARLRNEITAKKRKIARNRGNNVLLREELEELEAKLRWSMKARRKGV